MDVKIMSVQSLTTNTALTTPTTNFIANTTSGKTVLNPPNSVDTIKKIAILATVVILAGGLLTAAVFTGGAPLILIPLLFGVITLPPSAGLILRACLFENSIKPNNEAVKHENSIKPNNEAVKHKKTVTWADHVIVI